MATQGPHQGMPAQPAGHPQQVPINDQVANLKHLVGQLKECFSMLNRTMASNIQHNSQIDTGMKSSDGKVKSFEKPLEDFLSICNQVERNLKLISDCVVQQRDSQKYIPFSVSAKLENTGPVELANPAAGSETYISYNQYMNIVRSQVKFSKEVQDILTAAAAKIGQPETQPQVQATQSHALGNSS